MSFLFTLSCFVLRYCILFFLPVIGFFILFRGLFILTLYHCHFFLFHVIPFPKTRII